MDAGASLETEVGVYRAAALAMASNPRAGLLERKRLRESGRLEEVRLKDAEVVRYLLGRGADVNAQSSKNGDTALVAACRYGDRPTVLLLLEARADPNLMQTGLNFGETAFLTAARWGNADLLADLAAAGADVNATNYSSYLERVGSAAMWRAMYKQKAHLALLHRLGCDLSYANEGGVSAATLAADDGFPESLRFLLEEVRVPDRKGRLRKELQRLDAAES